MEKERRKFERVESLISVKYTSKTGEIKGWSLTKDLSKGGIGLPVAGKIPGGTRLNITIILLDGKKEIPATCKVVWSRKNLEHWKSRYSAGIKFVEIEPSDREKIFGYAETHRWIKSDFERSLEENKIPVLGGKGEFEI